MSSRELLALIEDFPETSQFKAARDRTYRVIEHDAKLKLIRAAAPLPAGAVIIARYVDWTFEQKLLARTAKETAAFRAEMRKPGHDYEPDFTGLTEPLDQIIEYRQTQAAAELRARAKTQIRSRLYAYETRR